MKIQNVTTLPTTERPVYDTATIAETHRRLLAEGHHVSENALRGWVRQGLLPAAQIGRKCLLFYPNVIKLLHEGTGTAAKQDESRPAYIPPRIAI